MKIAISGKARSGKDTIAKMIQEKYPEYTIIHFSDKLYELMWNDQQELGFPITKDRNYLQFIGTEWARAKDPNIWIKCLMKKVNELKDNIIVADVRFKNELEALKNDGFTLIRVNRSKSDMTEEQKNHLSEIDLDDYTEWDHIIDNNDTLEKLQMDIFKIF